MGVHLSDGDGTVPLISLGLMCRKGWAPGSPLNPSGMRVVTREYKHKTVSLLQDPRWVGWGGQGEEGLFGVCVCACAWLGGWVARGRWKERPLRSLHVLHARVGRGMGNACASVEGTLQAPSSARRQCVLLAPAVRARRMHAGAGRAPRHTSRS